MQFIIIDDTQVDIDRLRAALTKSYPSAEILPAGQKRFTEWADVGLFLAESISREGPTLVFCDMNLSGPEHPNAVDDGPQRCHAFKTMFPGTIFVAHTQYVPIVRENAWARDTFRGTIDKQKMQTAKGPDEQAQYVKQIVDKVLRTNAAAPSRPEATTRDSLALRLFEAAFGKDAADVIVSRFAADWTNIELRALGGGFSGAYVVRLDGLTSGAANCVVLKLSRDRVVIERELAAWKEFGHRLGYLVPHVTAYIEPIMEVDFDTATAWALMQMPVPGVDLLNGVTKPERYAHANRAAENLIEVLDQCCRNALQHSGANHLGERLTLTSLDRSRFEASVLLLRDLAITMRAHTPPLWPTEYPEPAAMFEAVSEVVNKWNRLPLLEVSVPYMVQHGDCNPSNVLLSAPENFTLIDVARSGLWPVGYDLSRLAIQLRTRVPGYRSRADYLPFGLNDWVLQTVANTTLPEDDGIVFDETFQSGSSREAARCDKVFAAIVADTPSHADALQIAYAAMTLWDLIKIVSYGDLSVFKRLWAVVECWRLSERLHLVESARALSEPGRAARISR